MASTSKRSAKVICYGGLVWVSPKQFWHWVRDGDVEYVSEPPLTGRFQGQRDQFLVSVGHTLLNLTCPEHLHAVVESRHRLRKQR